MADAGVPFEDCGACDSGSFLFVYYAVLPDMGVPYPGGGWLLEFTPTCPGSRPLRYVMHCPDEEVTTWRMDLFVFQEDLTWGILSQNQPADTVNCRDPFAVHWDSLTIACPPPDSSTITVDVEAP